MGTGWGGGEDDQVGGWGGSPYNLRFLRQGHGACGRRPDLRATAHAADPSNSDMSQYKQSIGAAILAGFILDTGCTAVFQLFPYRLKLVLCFYLPVLIHCFCRFDFTPANFIEYKSAATYFSMLFLFFRYSELSIQDVHSSANVGFQW